MPIEGISELICNAVTQRSYLDEGCVQVALFDDRLEVTSPGMLFGGLSIEDLKEGQSRPRNRGIASAFVAMKVIEQWGTGIPRIIEMCKEYELQEPEFIEIGMDFRVNLYRKHNTDKTEKQLIETDNQLIGKENQLIQGKNQLIEKVNQLIDSMDGNANTKENIRLLYEKLEDDQIFGRKEIMSITGLSINPAGTLIHKLLDMNLIVPVEGKGKGKYIFKISAE